MSITITIVGDTVGEVVSTLEAHLIAFRNVGKMSVDTIDNRRQTDKMEPVKTDAPKSKPKAEPAPAPAPTPEPAPVEATAASEPSASEAPTIPLSELLPMLTSAYRNGDQGMKDRIIALKNTLGLRVLAEAKTPEHVRALHAFVVAEGLA